jgi:hypothetical protein
VKLLVDGRRGHLGSLRFGFGILSAQLPMHGVCTIVMPALQSDEQPNLEHDLVKEHYSSSDA